MTLMPSDKGVHLMVKEIQHRARVYSLFDVAKVFLGSRERYALEFHVAPEAPALFRGKKDDCLFETREEAVAHFFASPLVAECYESEEIETEPPSGNFQVVARCGISGEWLGPPNFHGYQANLRRLHRERFASMPFDRYVSKVKTERGEEVVNEWLETMKHRVRWRPVGGGDDDWTFERSEIERDFSQNRFGDVFEETRETVLPGDVDARVLSQGVLAAVRIAGSHARRHPAMIIPALCRKLESDHLAIFKKQGKLFCGPSRPHPLVTYDELSERPAAIVRWLDEHPDSKLEKLWEGVLPEGMAEPAKEWLVDLFWLLSQGHVLLFDDGTLVLPKRRGGSPAEKSETAKPKKKKKKASSAKKKRNHPARHPSRASMVRRIGRMNAGEIKKLRGQARIWSRRLQRRDRILSLLDE